jgi:hypothetical protein
MATNSLQWLIDNYRQKVIMGEKHVDPESMVRDRCKLCGKCKRAGRKGMTLGCPDVMKDLAPFQKWIRVDRFVGEYMSGIAGLAADGRAPDVDWSNDLAIAKGMLDILDDCVNAAAEQEVRLRKLIPKAIAEAAANDSDAEEATPTPARDELLLDIYRWLRPQVSRQLAGGNQRTLEGKVFSSSIMGWWTVKFLNGLARFNPRFQVRRVNVDGATKLIEKPFPPEQMVGNFLNFLSAQKGYTFKERRNYVLQHSAVSVQGEDGSIEIEDDELQPDMRVALEEWRQHAHTSITDAVRVLPEPHRSVFQLMDIQGKSMAEAAELLGKTKDSLKHIHPAAIRMVRKLVPIQE